MSAPVADPRVLVGNETHDDAGVFLLDATRALVHTVDFLTPVVDDPYIFGQVAAANSLSDIYAMGATPLSALNLLAVPDGILSPQTIGQMLRGGQSILDLAETALLGGHSIDDPEPKIGYAVTGIVHPDRIWRNSTAHPGDRLFLSKPIGSGVIIKAIKDGDSTNAMVDAVIAMMTTLNRGAKEALEEACMPTAVTDVTGFGLLGHVWEMAMGAGVGIHIDAAQVPFLPGAAVLAQSDRFPSGSRRNLDYVRPHLQLKNRVENWLLTLLSDAVTSGGLVFTVRAEDEAEVHQSFAAKGLPLYAIGQVVETEIPMLVVNQ